MWKFLTFFDRCIEMAEKVLFLIAGALLTLMVFMITFSVIGRHFFNYPAAWTVELSEYILLFMTFFTASWILKMGGHVKLDLVMKFLPSGGRRLLELVTMFLGAMASFILAWFSLEVTSSYYVKDVVLLKLIHMPHYIVIAPIFIGSLMLGLRFLLQGISEIVQPSHTQTN
jgi:TRAP-type C4-dicarboxylate transport system permease small subunit